MNPGHSRPDRQLGGGHYLRLKAARGGDGFE
jgi:hypothetical protein